MPDRSRQSLHGWPLGMALEVGIYLAAIALSSLVALAAWLVF